MSYGNEFKPESCVASRWVFGRSNPFREKSHPGRIF
jgi:hypothetical protein